MNLTLEETEIVPAQTHRATDVSSARVDLFGARVLVAEDNSVNQKVVVRLLHNLGCAAFVVENGAEAIEALKDGEYDLVLMDCQMPIMDGYEATRLIRSQSGRNAGITIIALTASALAQDRERCLRSGMHDFLCKPIRKLELQAMLEQWLDTETRAAA